MTTSTETATRLPSGRRGPPREPTHCRPIDYARRRGISTQTVWRLRQMPGFPATDVFGLIPIKEADTFIAGLTREQLRDARRAENARHARRAQGATDPASVALPSANAPDTAPLPRSISPLPVPH